MKTYKPLDLAAIRKDIEFAQMLVKGGADKVPMLAAIVMMANICALLDALEAANRRIAELELDLGRERNPVHPCPIQGSWPCAQCGKHAHERYAEIDADVARLNAL